MKKQIIQHIILQLSLGLMFLYFFSCDSDKNAVGNNITNNRTSAVFNMDKSYGKLIDKDGNEYKTIKIGTQTWMAENLRTTKYRNGEDIPLLTDFSTCNNSGIGVYCNYNNLQNLDSIATYGRLYNWVAVTDSRGIAPLGWHVPSLEEWQTLESFLGDSLAGARLREAGTIHWRFPNLVANNETGFTALGSGYGLYNQMHGLFFDNIGIEGGWWTTTEDELHQDRVYHVTLGYNYTGIGGCNCSKCDYFSVRCVKD